MDKLQFLLFIVVRVTSQSYGDTEISWGQNSKTPKPMDEKFGVDDYVNGISLHIKNQNDRSIGSIVVYA